MNATATRTHFTAWLVNDTSCLDQDCMDITVLPDRLLTGDGDNDGDWSCDAGKPAEFYAVTTVDARDGDVKTAMDEAETLMGASGWRTVGDWDAVDNAYIVTVERDAPTPDETGEGAAAYRDVYWSVMNGPSPDSDAVQPEPAGITIPDDVLAWATGHGLDVDNEDVYLLLAPQEGAEDMQGEVAFMEGRLSLQDAAALHTALTEQAAQRAEDRANQATL